MSGKYATGDYLAHIFNSICYCYLLCYQLNGYNKIRELGKVFVGDEINFAQKMSQYVEIPAEFLHILTS